VLGGVFGGVEGGVPGAGAGVVGVLTASGAELMPQLAISSEAARPATGVMRER